jgi:hypothetical protein
MNSTQLEFMQINSKRSYAIVMKILHSEVVVLTSMLLRSAISPHDTHTVTQ